MPQDLYLSYDWQYFFIRWLAVEAGSSRGAGSGSVSLSELCLSLLLSLAAEQVHLTYSQHLSVLRGTKSSAASASLLEEAALQVIFDLTAAQSLALKDRDKEGRYSLLVDGAVL